MDANVQPVTHSERIRSLDILRGFALLGILIINIQSFAMPGSAYLNPSSFGDFVGIDKWVWNITYTIADMKMMAIFSVLYGAGIILFSTKAEQRGENALRFHATRSVYLLLFGLIHAHLIWHGDILVSYAICGMIVFFLRKKNPKFLIITGFAVLCVHTGLYTMFGFSLSSWPPDTLSEAMASWQPSTEMIEDEISIVTGDLWQQVSHNSEAATMLETFVFLILFLWRVSGLMLIGMALYKWGILSGKRSASFYRKGIYLGWIIGFPLVVYGVYQNHLNDWAYEYSMFLGTQWNYFGSLGVSFGYICVIMLISNTGRHIWLKERLAAVGQMAFTNYIMQSVLCVFIFWGVGFSLFGQLSRTDQLLVVLTIWMLQLAWSKPWLERFHFGPLEWLWRSLSYRKKQRFVKKTDN